LNVAVDWKALLLMLKLKPVLPEAETVRLPSAAPADEGLITEPLNPILINEQGSGGLGGNEVPVLLHENWVSKT
jgi:hypothetical protein